VSSRLPQDLVPADIATYPELAFLRPLQLTALAAIPALIANDADVTYGAYNGDEQAVPDGDDPLDYGPEGYAIDAHLGRTILCLVKALAAAISAYEGYITRPRSSVKVPGAPASGGEPY
jgi:hypothetical protein